MPGDRRIRVLHVVARLNRGGTETWLVHLLERLDRSRFTFDFATTTDQPGCYDEQVRQLGAGLFCGPKPSSLKRFGEWLSALLRNQGPYDVLHSHIDPCSLPLRWGYREEVPIRVAHCHNPGAEFRSRSGLTRLLLSPLSRDWTRRYATHGLATSHAAGDSCFGGLRGFQNRWRVLYCGLDLERFDHPANPAALRSELDVPPAALVVGHVGKFCRSGQKNQEFLLEIAREMVRMDSGAVVVFVGDGPRRSRVQQRAAAMGLSEHVRFVGSRADVPQLLRHVFDVFVFPSLYEGLGLALVEAQAAGLACLTADHLPEEAIVVPELVRRGGLGESPSRWAESLLAMGRSAPRVSRAEALAQVRDSRFDVHQAIGELQDFYEEAVIAGAGTRAEQCPGGRA